MRSDCLLGLSLRGCLLKALLWAILMKVNTTETQYNIHNMCITNQVSFLWITIIKAMVPILQTQIKRIL